MGRTISTKHEIRKHQITEDVHIEDHTEVREVLEDRVIKTKRKPLGEQAVHKDGMRCEIRQEYDQATSQSRWKVSEPCDPFFLTDWDHQPPGGWRGTGEFKPAYNAISAAFARKIEERGWEAHASVASVTCERVFEEAAGGTRVKFTIEPFVKVNAGVLCEVWWADLCLYYDEIYSEEYTLDMLQEKRRILGEIEEMYTFLLNHLEEYKAALLDA